MIVTIRSSLDYAIEAPCPILLQLEAAELPDQRVLSSELDVGKATDVIRVPADEGVGSRTWLRATKQLVCHYSAEVEIDRQLADIRSLGRVPQPGLPGEAVKFLMPSRYCQSDLFGTFVQSQFAGLEGGAQVAAMRTWIEENFAYVPGSSDAKTTVVDSFVQRQGICRDYAHMMITLARAAGMPARMVSVYAPDVTPPDFHAVAEIYVGGEWRLIDATGMAQPDTMVRIGVGRDAADIAFMIVYGKSELKAQSVAVKRG